MQDAPDTFPNVLFRKSKTNVTYFLKKYQMYFIRGTDHIQIRGEKIHRILMWIVIYTFRICEFESVIKIVICYTELSKHLSLKHFFCFISKFSAVVFWCLSLDIFRISYYQLSIDFFSLFFNEWKDHLILSKSKYLLSVGFFTANLYSKHACLNYTTHSK